MKRRDLKQRLAWMSHGNQMVGITRANVLTKFKIHAIWGLLLALLTTFLLCNGEIKFPQQDNVDKLFEYIQHKWARKSEMLQRQSFNISEMSECVKRVEAHLHLNHYFMNGGTSQLGIN